MSKENKMNQRMNVDQAISRLDSGDYSFFPGQIENLKSLPLEKTNELRIKFWNAIGNDYGKFSQIIPFEQAKRHFVDTVANNLPDGDLSILDLGCGEADIFGRILDLNGVRGRRINYLGLDASEKMVENGKKQLVKYGVDSSEIRLVDLEGSDWQRMMGEKKFNLVISNWGTMYLEKGQQKKVYQAIVDNAGEETVVIHSALKKLEKDLTLGEVLTPYGKAQLMQSLLVFETDLETEKKGWIVPGFIGRLKTLKKFGYWTGGNDSIFPEKMSGIEMREMMESAGFGNVKLDETQLLGTGGIVVANVDGRDPVIVPRRVSPQLANLGETITPKEFVR